MPERERFKRLPSNYFLTGEEHFWIGSTWDFQYGYPLTPSALIYFPDKLNLINKKRKEMKDTMSPHYQHETTITPNLSEAGYKYVYLSLEELDPMTGERKNTPRVTGLTKDPRFEKQNKIRDPKLLKKFSYNPRAFRDDRIALIDESIEDTKHPKYIESWQLKKELFLRYYRVD